MTNGSLTNERKIMSKRIEALTKEQIARFPEFVKKWEDIGLCTELLKEAFP